MGKERLVCTELLYSLVVPLFVLLDRFAGESPPSKEWAEQAKKSMDVGKRMLRRANVYLNRATRRLTQQRYLIGMLAAALTALVLPIWVMDQAVEGSVWTEATKVGPDKPLPVLVCLVAGGLGATVSVMARMTSGNLLLVANAPRWMAYLLGAVRVVLGAVFGLVVYFLAQSSIVPITLPPLIDQRVDPARAAVIGIDTKQFSFVASLAFIAGFSERFAQDALSVSSDRILPSARLSATGRGRSGGELDDPELRLGNA